MQPKLNKKILRIVVDRVVKEIKSPHELESILLGTLFEESQRLKGEKGQPHFEQDQQFYSRLKNKILKANPEQLRGWVDRLSDRFSREIIGDFDNRIYFLATRIVPLALNFLLQALTPLSVLRNFPDKWMRVEKQIEITGEIQSLKKIAKLGTVLFVPTHISNLDSIVVGYVLFKLGLPPFLYGAGLNLFSNKIMAFFMDHLGAYKVDRLKKSELYKRVLKNFATYTMELGYHHLFFPGGTRSRSGKVEDKIKLGLLGTGISAYIQNLLNNKTHPDIFVVPCTLNYQIVLEAKSLIEDYLTREGKSYYLAAKDEFSQVRRVFDFLKYLIKLDSKIQVVISEPLDLFGNRINDQGQSIDGRGRIIDRSDYVKVNGVPEFVAQRDHAYTEELSLSIVESFNRDTVINNVHLISRVVFRWLQKKNPKESIYRLIRTGGMYSSIPLQEIYIQISQELKLLHQLEKLKKIRLDKILKKKDLTVMLTDALVHLHDYHLRPVLERKGDQLIHHDRALLFYYQNRMAHLERFYEQI